MSRVERLDRGRAPARLGRAQGQRSGVRLRRARGQDAERVRGDWLTVIATGRGVGMTAEATAHQYPRPGVVYRPVRDAEPIAVRLGWWRDGPHPATQAAIELLTGLYRND